MKMKPSSLPAADPGDIRSKPAQQGGAGLVSGPAARLNSEVTRLVVTRTGRDVGSLGVDFADCITPSQAWLEVDADEAVLEINDALDALLTLK